MKKRWWRSIKNNNLYEKTVSLIEHGKIKQACLQENYLKIIQIVLR